MTLDCLIEILTKVEFEDEGLLFAENRHQDVLEADFELCGIHIASL